MSQPRIVLTQEMLNRYARGQTVVQNRCDEYLFVYQTLALQLNGRKVTVSFLWAAEAIGYPLTITGWGRKDSHRSNTVDLFHFDAFDIGPSRNGGDNRLLLHSPMIGEVVCLNPPNGDRLDPSKVNGLESISSVN